NRESRPENSRPLSKSQGPSVARSLLKWASSRVRGRPPDSGHGLCPLEPLVPCGLRCGLLPGPVRCLAGRLGPGWPAVLAWLTAWSGDQHPGPIPAGQAPADQVAQVHGGGAAFEPGVVPGGAAVAELEPASPPGGGLGDGAFHVGPVLAVVLAQGRAGSPVAAGGAQQVVVLVQDEGAAMGVRGAAGPQRAAAAGGAECDVTAGGDAAGDAVRAGDVASLLVSGEVVQGEPALHRGLERLGLDDR